MTERLGLGFEAKSGISPSRQRAHAFFLELLPILKPDVPHTLFETARRPFLEFLTESRDEILSLDSGLREPGEPVDTDLTDTGSADLATRLFVSGWAALQRQGRAGALCHALRNWGNAWDLSDDWCLDQATWALREQHLGGLSGLEAWHEAVGIELKLGSICTQGAFAEEFTQRGLHTFTFRYETIDFTVEGPMYVSVPQFRLEVERQFQEAAGRGVKGARTAFKHFVDEYLEKVKKAAEDIGLSAPPFRPAEDHFAWLIRYQIPTVMTYREIGRECGRDEKTVWEGVQGVATLIGLKLRSSEEDRRKGRPVGAKDKRGRFRASSK